MNRLQLQELLLQSLEHERGGILVYQTALKCVVNEDLEEEWQEYLEQTQNHERVLLATCEALGLDSERDPPGREIVKKTGAGLVASMEAARAGGDRAAAQLVACECVVLAETKDHLNWELLGKCAEKLTGSDRETLRAAVEEVEDQEDEHLYHTKGWCRELWLESLGLKAVLPPPEERKHIKTAIGAARAEMARDKMR
jgi:rubrerythrin